LLLGWVTQQVVGATVPAVVARGIHDAKRLRRSRDRNRRTRGGFMAAP